VVARPQALLLTGPVGSGKTMVLLELGELFEERGEPYALVDLDWLAWVRPGPGAVAGVDDVLVENLRAVWRTFRTAGVVRVALARALERREQLEAIRGALDGVDVFAVRLGVPPAVLAERLRRRDTGRELVQHLELAGRPQPSVFEDTVVDANRPPRDVALTVLALADAASP
jgi:adenylylsulfate kinase